MFSYKYKYVLRQGLLLLLLNSSSAMAATHFVSVSDPTCGGSMPCYSNIQAAVDAAADGDEIKVAVGSYSGSQKVFTTTAGEGNNLDYTQVVMIDNKSLTLRGGYQTSNWTTADPLNNPTVIDAKQFGRGVTVIADAIPIKTVTIDGFQIINGDYTELGSPAGQYTPRCRTTSGDCGGGMWVKGVNINLFNSLVSNNVASRTRQYSQGGGALFWRTGEVLVDGCRFSNNNNDKGNGGGLYVQDTAWQSVSTPTITIRNSQFDGNKADDEGGGLAISQVSSHVLVEGSRFLGNVVNTGNHQYGGGMAVSADGGKNIVVKRSEFIGNSAPVGSGLQVEAVGATQDVSVVLENIIAAENSGIDNWLSGSIPGTGVVFLNGVNAMNVTASHLTVVNNSTPVAIGVRSRGTKAVVANFKNVLIDGVAGSYGFLGGQVTSGSVSIDYTNTLFSIAGIVQQAVENGVVSFTSSGTLVAAPQLDEVHRLLGTSPAKDAGVSVPAVTNDIDGDGRPAGSAADIGADEYVTNVNGLYRFRQAAYSVTEGQSVQVTVERIGAALGATTVQYASSDGSATSADYNAVSGTLNFASNETSKTVTLVTVDDSNYDPLETINISLSNPSSGTQLSFPSQTIVTIDDNDASANGTLVFGEPTQVVNEDAGTVQIAVSRQGGTTGTVTVQYQTQNGSAVAPGDYTATSGTLTFPDGVAIKSFDVAIQDDSAVEGDEALNLILTAPTGGATLGAANTGSLTIKDNDSHGQFRWASYSYSVAENAGPATVSVERINGTQGQVTVAYTTAPMSAVQADFTATSGTLSFNNGDATAQQINVPIVNDALAEGAEAFKLVLSNPTNGAVITGSTDTQVTINDDESCAQLGATTYDQAPSHLFNGEFYCSVSDTIRLGDYANVGGSVSIENNALLILSAPKIRIFKGFSVKVGGKLRLGNASTP